jgi:hypothetical protein
VIFIRVPVRALDEKRSEEKTMLDHARLIWQQNVVNEQEKRAKTSLTPCIALILSEGHKEGRMSESTIA